MSTSLDKLAKFAAPTMALVSTALTFYLVKVATPPGSYVHGLFLERGWIQYASALCFWMTVAVLGLKHVASWQEEKALDTARAIVKSPDFDVPFIWSDAQMVRSRFAEDKYAGLHPSITFSRILRGLDRLRKSQSTSAFEEYFRTRSDHEASKLETSYAGIRYFVWLLPTLGLIGTVLGLGVGMSKFGGIIQNAENFQAIKKALPDVTNNLGTAFDATFLAIFLSAVAAFYMSFLQKRQEHILEEIDNLCIDEICALFQEHSTGSIEIVKALTDKVDQLITAMNGNRAQLEKDIEVLPARIGSHLEALGKGLTVHLEAIARSTARAPGEQRPVGWPGNPLDTPKQAR